MSPSARSSETPEEIEKKTMSKLTGFQTWLPDMTAMASRTTGSTHYFTPEITAIL